MLPVALPLVGALLAGCMHALEMDHMSAVTTFVTRRPHPAHAFWFGVRWALGHSAAILLAGGTLIALGLRPPEGMVQLLEVGVGIMLVGLGLWVIGGAWRRDTALRSESATEREHGRRQHSHPTTWVGAAHGLAGTAGFLALVPATMLATPWLAGAYLALFGVGTMLAMGLYAAGTGFVLHHIGSEAPRLARTMKIGAGFASIVVGLIWLFGAA